MMNRRKFRRPMTETGIGEVKSSRKSTGVKMATVPKDQKSVEHSVGSESRRDGVDLTKMLDASSFRVLLTNEVQERRERYPHLKLED